MRALTILLLFCSASYAVEGRTIKVTAMSEIKVAPDEVVLGLAVHTRDEDLLAAKQENDRIAAKVLALAPKHSVDSKDVKITDLDVSPDYYDGRARRQMTPVAYDFTRSIEIRLADFSKIEPLLSDAFGSGLSHVNRLHFRVSNQRQHQFEARRLAVTHAREKAEHLSELTGMRLGSPVKIEEDVEHNWNAGGFGGGISANRINSQGGKTRAIVFTSFEDPDDVQAGLALNAPGQITITAQVIVEFEMSPK